MCQKMSSFLSDLFEQEPVGQVGRVTVKWVELPPAHLRCGGCTSFPLSPLMCGTCARLMCPQCVEAEKPCSFKECKVGGFVPHEQAAKSIKMVKAVCKHCAKHVCAGELEQHESACTQRQCDYVGCTFRGAPPELAAHQATLNIHLALKLDRQILALQSKHAAELKKLRQAIEALKPARKRKRKDDSSEDDDEDDRDDKKRKQNPIPKRPKVLTMPNQVHSDLAWKRVRAYYETAMRKDPLAMEWSNMSSEARMKWVNAYRDDGWGEDKIVKVIKAADAKDFVGKTKLQIWNDFAQAFALTTFGRAIHHPSVGATFRNMGKFEFASAASSSSSSSSAASAAGARKVPIVV